MEPKLYYSKHCKHSINILNEINKNGIKNDFDYVCIDNRVVENRVIYIYDMHNNKIQLPPMINRVPCLILNPSEILFGTQINEYIKPKNNTIEKEIQNIGYQHPNPFSLGKNNLTSDNFSYINDNNFSNHNQPEDAHRMFLENNPKTPKIDRTLEEIENERAESIKQIENGRTPMI